eukprot:COSAG02_NODE_2032_length_10063_cov_11.627057_8_plen_223_part_00
MWADTGLRNVGRKLVIWDNCGPHKVDAVRAVFKEHGIAVVELPPNMTDRLQVIDLVTNGPLKSGMRRKRVTDLYDYMTTWRFKRAKALADGETLPPFDPPKPNVATALRNLFTVEMQVCQQASYKQSIRDCFYKACQFPDANGEFRRYVDVKSGLVGGKIAGIGSVDGDGTNLTGGCPTDNLSELEVVPNPNQRDIAEWSEESEDDDDLDEDESCAWLYERW